MTHNAKERTKPLCFIEEITVVQEEERNEEEA